MPHRLQYNPTLAAQHVTSRMLPFAMFGVTGGYGRTRAALVEAVRAGNHVVASGLFDKLVLEGIRDDAKENGFTEQEAYDGLALACKKETMFAGFVEGIAVTGL